MDNGDIRSLKFEFIQNEHDDEFRMIKFLL